MLPGRAVCGGDHLAELPPVQITATSAIATTAVPEGRLFGSLAARQQVEILAKAGGPVEALRAAEGAERGPAVRTCGKLATPEQFAGLVLARRGDRVVRLADDGVVFAGVEGERGIARDRGQPAVGPGIVRQAQANTIDVTCGAQAVVAALMPQFGASITHFVAYDESVYVERSIRGVNESLLIALVLVVLIIYAFIGGARATLVRPADIPARQAAA